jgi:hypothetical protein
MSVRRVLLAHGLVALIILLTAASPGPLSARQAAATGPSATTPGCPHVSPVLDIRADHKYNFALAATFNPIHGEWLVVWYTKQGPVTWDIWAARLDPDGRVITTFNVATDAGVQRREPAVAFSPIQQQYLIVYASQTDASNPDIYATRINWNGSWVSKEIALRVMPDKQYYPAVAYNEHDDEYLVVYTNVWAGGGKDVDARRVRAIDGQIKSWANIQSAADGGDRTLADVAYNHHRNEYLIAYDYANSSAGHSPQIRGKVAAASLAGLITDPEIKLCCPAPTQWGTSVAAGPDEYLVTFISGVFSAPIYGRRISPTGQPLGPDTGFRLTQNMPTTWAGGDLAFAGDRYQATWFAAPGGAPNNYNIYGCQAMAGYDWPAGDDFIIEDAPHWQSWPKLACAPHGQCLVVYEDMAPDGINPRIRGHFVTPCPRFYLPLVWRLALL